MRYFYIIDDIAFVPSEGYDESRKLSHEQAAEELRGKSWFWYIKDQEGETYRHLEDLARLSGVPLDLDADNLEQRKIKDHQRLSMGKGHKFLLIRDDLTYEFFAPAEPRES